MAMEKVNVYVISASLIKENLSFVLPYISKQRREKAEKYAFEKDQILSLGAAYLLKRFLPSENIKETTSGKPYLEGGPLFNVSHSNEYAVLAIHPFRDIGVDIEKIDDKNTRAIDYVLSDEEKGVSDTNILFQIWSNKESLIKCVSTGLKDIKSIKGLPLDGVRVFNNESFYSKTMIYEGYSLSVTLKGKEPFNININYIEKVKD